MWDQTNTLLIQFDNFICKFDRPKLLDMFTKWPVNSVTVASLEVLGKVA